MCLLSLIWQSHWDTAYILQSVLTYVWHWNLKMESHSKFWLYRGIPCATRNWCHGVQEITNDVMEMSRICIHQLRISNGKSSGDSNADFCENWSIEKLFSLCVNVLLTLYLWFVENRLQVRNSHIYAVAKLCWCADEWITKYKSA